MLFFLGNLCLFVASPSSFSCGDDTMEEEEEEEEEEE